MRSCLIRSSGLVENEGFIHVKELAAANERYTRQQSVSTPEENERRRKEVSKLSDELDEVQFRLNREVKKAQEKMVAPMQEKIVAAIKDIAASRRVVRPSYASELPS